MKISNIFRLRGKNTKYVPDNDLDIAVDFGEYSRSKKPNLPQANETQVVRHFTRLSQLNFGLDTGFYPLGSCTMKYNPKINETLANLEGFTSIHPYQNTDEVQGALELMYDLGEFLKDISGLDAVTLIPAAGAHGESTGLKLIDAYHKANGGFRPTIIVPDTAHGTNPASSTMTGHNVISVKSGPDGTVKYEDIEPLIDENTAAFMVTNPNTLGIFEKDMHKIAKKLHSVGALLYCDGANTNAWMGKVNMGELGVDVLQYNLHKTFSTPHGGGGPGSGPVAVSKKLIDFLPSPVIKKLDSRYILSTPDKSIGKIKSYYGNFLVMVKAYAYILSLGQEGMKAVSSTAVLNANYIKERLKNYYYLPYDVPSMHEVVFTDKYQSEYGVKTMDIAKRLLDYGMHAPTVYFPLVVSGAIMIEPTETESLESMDKFCDAMIEIAKEVKENTEIVLNAPHTTPVKRVNEAKAAKDLILRENV